MLARASQEQRDIEMDGTNDARSRVLLDDHQHGSDISKSRRETTPTSAIKDGDARRLPRVAAAGWSRRVVKNESARGPPRPRTMPSTRARARCSRGRHGFFGRGTRDSTGPSPSGYRPVAG